MRVFTIAPKDEPILSRRKKVKKHILSLFRTGSINNKFKKILD